MKHLKVVLKESRKFQPEGGLRVLVLLALIVDPHIEISSDILSIFFKFRTTLLSRSTANQSCLLLGYDKRNNDKLKRLIKLLVNKRMSNKNALSFLGRVSQSICIENNQVSKIIHLFQAQNKILILRNIRKSFLTNLI